MSFPKGLNRVEIAEGLNCDINVIVNGVNFLAHKSLLASTKFEQLIQSCCLLTILVNAVEPHVFRKVLFLYLQQIEENDLQPLNNFADPYGLEELKNVCGVLIALPDVENVCNQLKQRFYTNCSIMTRNFSVLLK